MCLRAGESHSRDRKGLGLLLALLEVGVVAPEHTDQQEDAEEDEHGRDDRDEEMTSVHGGSVPTGRSEHVPRGRVPHPYGWSLG